MSGIWTVAEYGYDGAKRRSVKEDYSSGVLDETRHFFYTEPSKWQVVEERVDSSSDADRQFVWGLRYIDDIVERHRDTTSDSTLDERLYGIQDANWNVTGLIDDNGELQERYCYGGFGAISFLSAVFEKQIASSVDWETAYSGYRYDVRSAIYHVRHRVYHCRLGLWLRRDPLGSTNADTNLYAYAAVSPIGNLDPSGLAPRTCEEACTDYRLTPEGSVAIGGGVICNDGMKCTCVFGFPEGHSPGFPGVWPERCPAIDEHITRHERGHFVHVECHPCPSLYRPIRIPDLTETMAECELRRQDVIDLDRLIPIETNPHCKYAMEKMREMQKDYVDRYCTLPRPRVRLRLPNRLPPVEMSVSTSSVNHV